MPTKATTTTAKRVQKPKATKSARVFYEETFSDHLEILLDKTLITPASSSASGLHVLIYNATPAMQELAYKHGFSIGKLLAQRRGSVDALLSLLERSGLGPMLYSPSDDVSHIQSTARKSAINLTGPVHHYERGLISGYFSAYTDSPIVTVESACSWDGDEACIFTSWPDAVMQPRAKTDLHGVISGLSTLISQQPRKSEQPDVYTLLALQPLLSGATSATISRLLYVACQKLGSTTDSKAMASTVARIGSFLGVHAILAGNTKAKKSITITYTLYSSTSQYIALTLPAFTGLFSREYAQESANVRRNAAGVYVVSLDLKRR